MKTLLILIFILIGCGEDDMAKKSEFDDLILRVDIMPYDGVSHEMVKVQITSECDRYPLPMAEAVARTKEKAMAYALKKMSNDILKALQETKELRCNSKCS